MSYCGSIHTCLTIDPDVVTQPEKFVQCYQDELNDLRMTAATKLQGELPLAAAASVGKGAAVEGAHDAETISTALESLAGAPKNNSKTSRGSRGPSGTDRSTTAIGSEESRSARSSRTPGTRNSRDTAL